MAYHCNEGSVSEEEVTPRPSHSHSLGRSHSHDDLSFFGDFFPQAPTAGLVNDIRTVVNDVAQTGVSIASALVKGPSNSPPPSNTPPPVIPPSSPLNTPLPHNPPSQSPTPPPPSLPPAPPFSPSPPPMATATVLPLPKDINVKDVKNFDGSPANLSMFDTQIENALDRWDIPAYYGSCVSGDVYRGFEFVPATSPMG